MDFSPKSALRQLINDEFYMERYSEFKKWYFNKYKHWELAQFRDDYYNELKIKQDYIPFVKWFLNHILEKIKNEIFVLKSKPWISSGGETINSPFPPE
jgi:hypothetical protein